MIFLDSARKPDNIATGEIKPRDMITKIITLDNVVEEGFESLVNDKANQIKILIDIEVGV